MKRNSARFDVERLSLFPTSPGVYIMKDDAGKILYIGKAKNIRSRLRTYFSKTGDGRFSVNFFLPKVSDIEFFVTNTEKEAFLLENILVKKHQPRYNIMLRDDKTYISLRIDLKKTYPRLQWVRRRKKDDALYFGPYSSAASVRSTVRFLQKIFPLRTCSDRVIKNRTRPCIRYQMKRCLAPCTRPVSVEEYRQLVNGIVLYLRGNMKELKRRLQTQMAEYAAAMRYEKAAELRDKIAAIDATIEKQTIASEKTRDLDVIAHHTAEGECCIVSFQYRLGVLAGTRTFFFAQQGRSAPEIYYAFIGQYYGEDKFIPAEILVAAEPDERLLLEEWLSDLRGAGVRIAVPKRGRRAAALRLVLENASEQLKKKLEGERDLSLVLESLKRKLHLPEIPTHIEGFDISNIQGRLAVGSMVVFTNGKPDSSQYRHFKIRTVLGSDDFAMMHEVILRRYRRLKEEGRELPDLILIDGGKGQLNAAHDALRQLGLEGIGIIGLAKSHLKEDRTHPGTKYPTGERVFLPNRKNPIILRPGSPALFLIQRVRDEAHRFAITYHKKLRSKAQRHSVLEEIPGIGQKRKRLLLKHFGSLSAIKKATRKDLADVSGITESTASNIYRFFHPARDSESQST